MVFNNNNKIIKMKTKVTEVAATSQTSHQLHADPATTRSVRVFSSRPDVSSTFVVVVVRPPSPPPPSFVFVVFSGAWAGRLLRRVEPALKSSSMLQRWLKLNLNLTPGSPQFRRMLTSTTFSSLPLFFLTCFLSFCGGFPPPF